MHIPRAWAKATADCRTSENRDIRVAVWGCGPEEDEASRDASSRLARVLERIRRGDPLPGAYAYGSRPLREEILQTCEGETPDEPDAIVTRNRYGAMVLNTARLLFLDIDFPPSGPGAFLRRLFSPSRPPDDEAALSRLRDAAHLNGGVTLRLYRTAAGLRAIAIGRDFDPLGRDAKDLMTAAGTDPAFMNLCVVQKSFRARLTPKPWRCRCPLPPGEHPRTDDEVRQRFADWLGRYESVSSGYATCRYLETVGSARLTGTAKTLVTLHDRVTRAIEALPLA